MNYLNLSKAKLTRNQMQLINGGDEMPAGCFDECTSNSQCGGECSTCVPPINGGPMGPENKGACGT